MKIDFQQFKKSVEEDEYPPSGINELLKAMWYAANNEWNAAHRITQENGTVLGSLVHAYLHRVEDDLGNASYWYARAGKTVPKLSFNAEWDEISKELIKNLG